MATVENLESLSYDLPLARHVIEGLGIGGLHCGCGDIYLGKNWLNTDLAKLSDSTGNESKSGAIALVNDDYYYLEHDATAAFPLDNEVFDWIFAEHFIEHITTPQAVFWLKEAKRMLKPGGIIRLSTPNLCKYANVNYDARAAFFKEHHSRCFSPVLEGEFRNIDNLSLEQIKSFVEGVSIIDPGMDVSYCQDIKRDLVFRNSVFERLVKLSSRPAFMINQIFYLFGHKWIYDLDEVALVAQKAGFEATDIHERGFRQGDVEELYTLDQPIRDDESLYVEIYKR